MIGEGGIRVPGTPDPLAEPRSGGSWTEEGDKKERGAVEDERRRRNR
ncbi:MAG: hypothetical protein LC704_00625 [Actinobacteria bacterium]|nr:hypothetical protein [Actinomycetota bacterium]